MDKPLSAFPVSPESCVSCGRLLTRDEMALTKKMVNRGSTRFFCIRCLAEHFDVSEEMLHRKIQEYREMGCTLFTD